MVPWGNILKWDDATSMDRLNPSLGHFARARKAHII